LLTVISAIGGCVRPANKFARSFMPLCKTFMFCASRERLHVFEQPIRPNRISGFQKLRKQGSLPIIMDEGVVNAVELEEFIKLGMCDGVAIKLARCGGLTEARRQVELLFKYDLMFWGSGLADPDLSLAAMLALYGAYDLKYPAALNGAPFWRPAY